MNKNKSDTGFTLLEVMLVIALIAALAALSIPAYQDYTQRARASELLAKYDAVRTGVLADLNEGAVGSCAKISETVEAGNLEVENVRLSIDYQAVSSDPLQGYRPVFMVCAKAGRHGNFGVGIAHAAHHEFDLTNKVESGAVVTDSVVSFAVPLTRGNAPSCYVPVGSKLTACGDPVAVPSLPAVATPNKAPVVAPAKQVVLAPQCRPPQNQMVERHVMTFGNNLDGYVMNNGNLDTGGDMKQFAVEAAIVGGAQVASSGVHGATIISYAVPGSTNEFLVWNPAAIKIEWKGSDINTGVNVNDGQNHRITFTFDSSTGQMTLYDNGKSVWSEAHHQGETVAGNGKLVLGQDQDSYGGGFHHNDAFQGQIMAASMANRVPPPDRISAGPLHTALTKDTGLITSVVTTATGPVDTTGQNTYTSGGGLQSVSQMVDSGLYVTADCK